MDIKKILCQRRVLMKKILITFLLIGSTVLTGCGNKIEVSSSDGDSEIMQNVGETEEIEKEQSNNLDDELLVSFRKGDKWGAMTLDGEVVIEPQYTNRLDFINGLSLVREDGKFGYVNKNNEMVVEPQYDDAREFQEGFAGVCIKKTIGNQEIEKWGFIDTNGEVIFELECDEIGGYFSEGVANVCIAGKWGYIDTDGKFVREPKYDKATEFRDGTAVVTKGETEYLIQRENFWIIMENNNPDINIRIYNSYYYDGLVYIDRILERDEHGMVSDYIQEHLNIRGETEIEYDFAGEFSEGLAPVYDDGYWGYVNTENEWVVLPQYEAVGKFSEGVAVVASQGYQYLIDTEGNIVFQTDQYDFYDVSYNSPESYTDNCMKNGMILTKDEENYYILNRAGEIIWKTPEEEESHIWINENMEHGGNFVWHENYYPECDYSWYEQIAYIDENGNVIWDRRDYDY